MDSLEKDPFNRRSLRSAIGSWMVAAVVLTGLASWSAWSALGAPFPSFFVDPYGFYSTVELPGWGLDERARPERVISVEGVPLGEKVAFGDFPADRLKRSLVEVRAHGRTSAVLTVEKGGLRVQSAYPLRAVGVREVWSFFGMYALSGWFVLWSGAVVALIARRREGGRAYSFWAVGTFLFLITLFDYHTTRMLAPLFAVSTTWVTLGFAWLAHSFPDPPAPSRRLRAATRAGGALLGLAAAALLVAPALGESPRTLQALIPIPAVLCLLALVAAMVIRLRSATGRARAELLSASSGLILMPIFLILTITLGLTRGSGLLHLTLPFIVFTIPAAIGYALIRHNILATTVVLSRALLLVPVVAFSAIVAPAITLALWDLLQRHDAVRAAPIILGTALFAALFAVGRRLVSRAFLPATSEFRPTIEQLTDRLSSLREQRAVRDAVKGVTRWLSAADVDLLEPDGLGEVQALPEDGPARVRAGDLVWTQESAWRRRLLVPMRSLGELRGVLLVAPKHQAALYNSEDLKLLQTIAGLGALALHHADVMDQLASLRRLEVDAARGEKRLTLEMLGAELSHEIAYPLNYFRFLLKRAERGQPLAEPDVAIGREEVERLERMVATLRKLKPPPVKLAPLLVSGPLRRALELLRDPLDDLGVTVTNEVPEDLVVVADHDPLLQMFANLLRNALQAAGRGGKMGVRRVAGIGATALEVWDSGPGVPEEIQGKLFDPWVTAKEGGLGLGLAVTQRIVLAFGWTITFSREGGFTRFRVHVPATPPAERAPRMEAAE